MKYFRKLIACKKLAVFFALGMLLRSTIAIGYMLNTNPADGGLFSIIICEGPAGINAITDLEDHSQHHGNHHSEHDNEDDRHDHAAQDHAMSSCSFWSSSSHSLLIDSPFFNTQNFFLADEVIFYQNHVLYQIQKKSHFARAPPTFV